MGYRSKSSGSRRALLLALALSAPARAGQLAHYAPGQANIRDPFLPEPGTYLQLYVPFSHAGEFHDAQGNAVHAVTVNTGSGTGARVNVNVNANVLTVAPSLQWIAPWTVLGASYGAVISPSFGNANTSSAADGEFGASSASNGSSSLSAGDLFVEPLWLGWPLEHWEFSAAYGVYAPTGKYNVETKTLTDLQGRTIQLRDPTTDSVGLGFWEHQFQGAAAWYPRPDKHTAVVLTGTYELNGNKRFEDLTPGSYFTLNWGLSQYLPLRGEDLLLEIGPAGFVSWQTSHDRGGDVQFAALTSVAAAGFQTGLTYAPWGAFLDFQYSREFLSKARTQGETYTLSMARKIF